mgnify:CR=1 FL=1
MELDRRFRSFAMRILSNEKLIDNKKRRFEFKRKLLRQPHQVEYFHQVDDPYSHLSVQVLEKLADSYNIELIPRVVCEPDDVDVSERELLKNYGRRDVQSIAPHYGLSFTDAGVQPSKALIILAQQILVKVENVRSFSRLALEVGEALWSNNKVALDKLASSYGLASVQDTHEKLNNNHKRRAKLGHFLGGTFYYGTEWYWGVDRFNYLEQRLNSLGLNKPGVIQSVVKRPVVKNISSINAPNITVEYFCSMRSPYTYISIQEVYDLVARTNVNLVMRPILPMMMRGVPLTTTKGKYFLSDCLREANHTFKVPFGNICDTFGDPVKRGYSLFEWARQQGKAEALFKSFTKAVFAERIDAGADKGMQYIVQQAGLSWLDAKKVIDNKDWEPVLESNRLTLYNEMGQWGAPSFRISGGGDDTSFSTWGSDRLWLVESEIQRRSLLKSTTAETKNVS